jgi:hypothetical protein
VTEEGIARYELAGPFASLMSARGLSSLHMAVDTEAEQRAEYKRTLAAEVKGSKDTGMVGAKGLEPLTSAV